MAFSPDGKRLISGGMGRASDATIKVWESTTPAGGYEPRRTAAAARTVVGELRRDHGLYSQVIDELKADKTIDQSVRRVALQIANARLWEDEQEKVQEKQEQAEQ